MTVVLPTMPVAVEKVDPVVLIIYGATKVGKTALLSDLKNNLIFDLERGAETYECLRVRIDTFKEFYDAMALLKEKHNYEYVTIDTIDRLVEWLEQSVVTAWNASQEKVKDPQKVSVYSEIPYGKGYDLVRMEVRKWINGIKKVVPHLILVGHLKRTIIGDTTLEVKEDNLDLVGKLRNLLCADADAVAFAYRDKADGKPALKFSFKASESTAAGSRLPHLKGKIHLMSVMEEDGTYKNFWKNIYPNAEQNSDK